MAGSFSAVSKRNFARKYAFDSIFQALQDVHTFAPLQTQHVTLVVKNRSKKQVGQFSFRGIIKFRFSFILLSHRARGKRKFPQSASEISTKFCNCKFCKMICKICLFFSPARGADLPAHAGGRATGRSGSEWSAGRARARRRRRSPPSC